MEKFKISYDVKKDLETLDKRVKEIIKDVAEVNKEETTMTAITIINCTPHVITLVNEDGSILRQFSPSGILPRVSVNKEPMGLLDDGIIPVPLYAQAYGTVVDLPEQKENTFLIVSGLVASAAKRGDLLVPGDQVRDEEGRVIGCKFLAMPAV